MKTKQEREQDRFWKRIEKIDAEIDRLRDEMTRLGNLRLSMFEKKLGHKSRKKKAVD